MRCFYYAQPLKPQGSMWKRNQKDAKSQNWLTIPREKLLLDTNRPLHMGNCRDCSRKKKKKRTSSPDKIPAWKMGHGVKSKPYSSLRNYLQLISTGKWKVSFLQCNDTEYIKHTQSRIKGRSGWPTQNFTSCFFFLVVHACTCSFFGLVLVFLKREIT